MDDKRDEKVKTQAELEETPRTTLAKNMRDAQELFDESKKKDANLTPDEERLVDLLTFHKSGKHIDKFKGKPVEPEDPTPSVEKIREPVFLKGAPSVGTGKNRKTTPIKATLGLESPQILPKAPRGTQVS